MLNPNPYMVLSGVLGFSAADLTANRLGVLTANQRQALAQQRLRTLGLLASLILVVVVGGHLLQVGLVVIAFCAACLISILLATLERFNEDFEGRVEAIAGNWALRRLPLGRYGADVGGQLFNLPKPVKTAFNEQARYRVYYTPGTRRILSAEMIS